MSISSSIKSSPFSGAKPFDYDGDGKADVAVYRPSDGTWRILNSSGGSRIQQWGYSTDVPVPGDYDGDGKTDVAVWRPADGNWWILNSSNGSTRIQQWGYSSDIPVAGDYDGDGKTDTAIFRPSDRTWWILNSSNGTFRVQQWGFSGDKPVPGDYDGDGKTDIAVWRPSDGNWWILNSSGGFRVQQWGYPSDIPVPGDYDGDGKTDIGVWRPADGNWWILNSSGGYRVQQWGYPSDITVPADYDGDGKTDIAVFRPSDNSWWILKSTGSYSYLQWGNSGDVPASKALAAQVCASGGGSGAVPQDGLGGVSYGQTTNRINTAGWEYDAAGNQTRVQRTDGSWQRYVYDAAGRLVKVQNDSGVTQIIHTYGASNHRLIEQVGNEGSNQRTYYGWAGDSVIAEYEETAAAPTTPRWLKSYVYLGARLLATIAPNGQSERVEYQHPDRLGTRLVSNNQDTFSFEQAALPFGTALDAESSGSTKRRFTSYDRSTVSGLDYAVNRHYDPLQGRFTQVDPIGMGSVSIANPQTLNLYAYCANDPINHTDPSGLGFFSFLKKVFSFFAKVAKWVAIIVAVAVIVAAVLQVGFNIQLLPILGDILSKLGILKLGGVGASFTAGASVGVGLGATSYVLGGLAAAGAVNSFLQKKGGQSPTNTADLRTMLNEFYKKYQGILARCIWKVFASDRNGNPSNIAQIMQRQTLGNAPVSNIVLGYTGAQIGGQGRSMSSKIYIASDLRAKTLDNGRQVSIEQSFFRVYAHELGNHLSWLYTGDMTRFGTTGGIRGQTVFGGLHSVMVDDDTGARLEKCIWGDVQY